MSRRLKIPEFRKVPVSAGMKWNYTCGNCAAHYMGVADSQIGADTWGIEHKKTCRARWWGADGRAA
jgi:hypothetical protein